MEFSGSSRLTLSMYRAQVRIFSEKLNSRILRPGGGRGRVEALKWCLCQYLLGSARLGLPPPPACLQLPCSACRSCVYLVHFGLPCESPLCEVKTPRAAVVWRRGASFGKQERKFNVSKPWSVANWVRCFSDSLSQRVSAGAELSNPSKKNNRGTTGRDYKTPDCTHKGWRQVWKGERWSFLSTMSIQDAEETECSYAGWPVGGAVCIRHVLSASPGCLISSDATYSQEPDVDVKIIWGWTNSSENKTEAVASRGDQEQHFH